MRAILFLLLACGGAEHRNVEVATLPTPQCPPGTSYNGSACTEPPHADPEPSPVAPSTTIDEARDTRGFTKRLRSPALLVTEVNALEQLLAATPKTAPDYPQLVRRIGDDYSELFYAAPNPQMRMEALKKAVFAYFDVVQSFPTYAQIDEVRYDLAYSYELVKDSINARKTYYDLIMKHPSSKKIPYAYYAFGEMFFEEAKSDPTKYKLAEQAYEQTLKYPDPDLSPWTLLRLGETYLGMSDQARAAQTFAKLRAQYPQSAAASKIP